MIYDQCGCDVIYEAVTEILSWDECFHSYDLIDANGFINGFFNHFFNFNCDWQWYFYLCEADCSVWFEFSLSGFNGL